VGAAVRRLRERMLEWPATAPRSFLWALFAALVLLRFPFMFRAPTFYAEEGIVYFRYALEHDIWDALTASHIGYYSLVSNLGGVLASWVPLRFAPLITSLFGLVFPTVCAHLLIEYEISLRSRAWALAVLVFTVTMRAEWSSTIHSQFWLAAAMTLLLGSTAPRGPAAKCLQGTLVLVAAATGVVSCLLAPIFGLASLRLRERRFAVIAITLAAALGAHVLSGASRSPSWGVSELLSVVLLKLAVFPFVGRVADPLGHAAYVHASEASVAVAIVLLLAAWFAFVILQSKGRWRWVSVASLLLGSLSIYFALPPYDTLALAMAGSRYSFAGVVPVCIALVCSRPQQGPTVRRVVAVLVLFALIAGAVSGVKLARDRWASPSHFAADVSRFATDRGVTMELHQPRCRLSVNAAEQRQGFEIRGPIRDATDELAFEIIPGRYDRGVAVGVFVLATGLDPTTRITLGPDGWDEREIVYYGFGTPETGGRCYGGADPSLLMPREAFRGSRHSFRLTSATIDALPSDVEEIFIGYGRDYADALAKGTFRPFELSEVRDAFED
jgi:hypothetical protein